MNSPLNKTQRREGPLLVVIGASAGGPSAVAELLEKLPADFRGAIVIVQHLDSSFAADLIAWWGKSSKLPVRAARHGDTPTPGVVLVAATDEHLLMGSSGHLYYGQVKRSTPYSPSIDEFFLSVGRHWKGTGIGLVLTGMGSDGAKGLLNLRENGFHSAAQDEESSAIFGMPKAAAKAGAAQHILDLEKIPNWLLSISQKVGVAN